MKNLTKQQKRWIKKFNRRFAAARRRASRQDLWEVCRRVCA
jgi:hypothetical protein